MKRVFLSLAICVALLMPVVVFAQASPSPRAQSSDLDDLTRALDRQSPVQYEKKHAASVEYEQEQRSTEAGRVTKSQTSTQQDIARTGPEIGGALFAASIAALLLRKKKRFPKT